MKPAPSPGIKVIAWTCIYIIPLSLFGSNLFTALTVPASWYSWQRQLPELVGAFQWNVALLFARFLLIVWFIAAGIGLLRLRAWAWQGVLCSSVGTLVVVLTDLRWEQFVWELAVDPSNRFIQAAKTTLTVGLVAQLLWIAGSFFLLTRSTVRGQFQGNVWRPRFIVLVLIVLCTSILVGHSVKAHGWVLEYLRIPGNAGTTLGPRGQKADSNRWVKEAEKGYKQERATPVQPGTGTITGLVTFNGVPIQELTQVPFQFVFSDEKTRQWPKVDWQVTNSQFEAKVPTGIYHLEIKINANQENGKQMPGDFHGNAGTIKLVHSGETVRTDVRLEQLTHLIRPEDLKNGLPRRHGDPKLHFKSPVQFEWEAVPGATQYHCWIYRLTSREGAKEIRTSDTSWLVELPPNVPGGFYVFRMDSTGPNGANGTFEVTGKDFWGFTYEFVVD